MPDQLGPDEPFPELWKGYVSALQQLVTVRRRRPPQAFLASFEAFFDEAFRGVTEDAAVEDLTAAWSQFEADDSNHRTARLLRLELVAFINGFQAVTGSPARPQTDPPSTKHWLSRDATAKDMTNAGKTVLESILDALGDLLPVWVRGLLKILKEVLDVAAG